MIIYILFLGGGTKKVYFCLASLIKGRNLMFLFFFVYPEMASRILKRIGHIISICQIVSFRTPVT